MNKLLSVLLATLVCTATAHASHDYNSIIRDGIIGGVIGGIIGNNTGDGDSRTGALIGATTAIIKGMDSKNKTTHHSYGHTPRPRNYEVGYNCNPTHTHTHSYVRYKKVWVHAKEVVRYGQVIRLHDGYWKYVPEVVTEQW